MKFRAGSGALTSAAILVLLAGGILALLALPKYRAYRIRSNEDAAQRAMKVLEFAQNAYYDGPDAHGKPRGTFWMGDVSDLLAGMPGVPTGIAEADPVRSPEDATPYHGYLFRAVDNDAYWLGRDPNEAKGRGPYAICAYPAHYGRSGKLTYFINGCGTYAKDTGGAALPRAVTLLELRMEGWSYLP
jgi:hypothetical protein